MKKCIVEWIKSLIAVLIGLSLMLPVWETVILSFVRDQELSNINISGFLWIPPVLSLTQYYTLLVDNSKYLQSFWNSFFLSSCITILQAIMAIPASYVLSKIQFRGRRVIRWIFLLALVLPQQVLLVPVYILCRTIGIYNNWLSLLFPMMFSPLGVCLLMFAFHMFPDELMEAARIETGNIWTIMWHIIVPCLKPFIFVLLLISFTESWNMIEQPLILLSDKTKYPLSLLLSGAKDNGGVPVWSGAVLFMIPAILAYWLSHEDINMMMEASSVK
ncbi:carbohydrate ABC transporter permease [Clostridiales bacterium FE2011]|nr:carbohydrate ABC transporter permease [Clostridiales bacterium FE2011]